MKYYPYLKGAVGWLLGMVCLVAVPGWAQVPTELDVIRFVGDVHQQMPASGGATIFSDDEGFFVFDFNSGTTSAFNTIGNLDQAGVDGYEEATSDGDTCSHSELYSLDSTAMVSGIVVRPADVFGFGFKMLDGQAAGIPAGVNVDAFSIDPVECDLVFSIDVIASLGGVVYKPDDLIRWDGTAFSLYRFVNFGVNIDALHILDGGRFLYSIDSDGEVPGLVVQDDDVLESIPGGPGGSFEVLAFSPRVFDSTWEAADLVALWARPAPSGGDFSFTQATVEIFENAGPLVLTVMRQNGTEGSVTIDWTATPGTATHPADYQPPAGIVNFGDGVSSNTFAIALNNDVLQEGDEQFTVQLSVGVGDGNIVSPSTITVTIIDDETTIFKDSFED